MARAIFRSGRIVYVWHRFNEDATGFYTLTRRGYYLGPYRARDHIDNDITNSVVPTARRRERSTA